MEARIRRYLAEIGRKGGQKSRRALTPEQAKKMVKVREARRAFQVFYASCFWSFDPNYKISANDIPWVAEQLKKYGSRRAWEKATELCR